MGTFNLMGCILFVLLMFPNIFLASSTQEAYKNRFNNKLLFSLESIGRYGCMVFFIINIPYTYQGFYFENAQYVYLLVNSILLLAYYTCWIYFAKKSCIGKAISLSLLPSILFFFSGCMIVSAPLLVFSCVFAYAHIKISVINENIRESEN